jgi:hypothetical protein
MCNLVFNNHPSHEDVEEAVIRGCLVISRIVGPWPPPDNLAEVFIREHGLILTDTHYVVLYYDHTGQPEEKFRELVSSDVTHAEFTPEKT